MAQTTERYIPALNVDWLTPVYDGFLRRTMQEDRFKRQLIAQARIQSGHQVLDLGCGTGTLAVLIKQHTPGSAVMGLDVDPRVLQMAAAKATQAGVDIAWRQGSACALPYADASFDRVLSTLVMHHLTGEQKRAALRVRRVLRPGGELHIADFGPPHRRTMRLVAALLMRVEETEENFRGLLPPMMQDAGFVGVAETDYFATPFGPMSLYRAVCPYPSP